MCTHAYARKRRGLTQLGNGMQTDLAAPYEVDGVVRIELDVKEASPCLVLHAIGLEFGHVALVDPHAHGMPLHLKTQRI
jgi:hypothetical protein